MEPLLRLLENNAALRPDQLSVLLDLPEADIIAQIKAAEANQTILSYRAVLNEDKLGIDKVRAVIEVRITPEREGGFDRLAERVAQFAEVRSCYLMSGDYDLLVVVEGDTLRQAAAFVSEKLAPLHGIVSTVTHFILKPYKLEGVLMKEVTAPERLAVAP